jgi:hypothetical protein
MSDTEREVDLIQRDPNNMNSFLQVDYEDVLAEPQGVHSTDWYSFNLILNECD